MSSSLTLKVQFQHNDGKVSTRDIKCSPLTSSLSLKIEAAALFDLKDHKKYALFHKRQLIPSCNSLKDSSIAPGSTINLGLRGSNSTSKPVSIHVRFNNAGRMIKASGTFPSSALFLAALQKLNDGERSFNALQIQANNILPILTTANTQLDWKLLACLTEYSFNDLDINGNQLFSLSHASATANDVQKFSAILTCLSSPTESDTPINVVSSFSIQSDTSLTHRNQPIFNEPAQSICEFDFNTVQFSVFKQLPSSKSAPDLPDSFYELTMDEFKSFQSGYKKAVRDIVDRPFVSAKMQLKNDFSSHKELLTIKFVFPDYVCVTVSIPTTCKASDLYQFLEEKIVSEGMNFNLMIGPPMKLIQRDNKSLVQLGISTSTKIIVDCLEKLNYRLQIE